MKSRKHNHDDEDIFDLSDEDWKLIGNVIKPPKMSLEDALLSDDPLGNINHFLPGNTPIQQQFRLLYAAILEVNASGISILFDRFPEEELQEIVSRYEAIGAQRFCQAYEAILNQIREALGTSATSSQIQDYLDRNEHHSFGVDSNEGIVEEMEKSLLAWATVSLTELSNDPSGKKARS